MRLRTAKILALLIPKPQTLNPKPYLLFLLFVLVACSPTQTPAPPIEPAPIADESEAADGFEMYFYENELSETGERRPTFRVTGSLSSQSSEPILSLEDAYAIIYSNSEDEPNIEINAGTIRLDRTTEQAVMEAGVTLQRGTMTITLQDLAWKNEERIAESKKPVTILDNGSRIELENLTYFADEHGRIYGAKPEGVITIKRNVQP